MRRPRRLLKPLSRRSSRSLPTTAAPTEALAITHREACCSVLVVDADRCDSCGECMVACEAARRLALPASGACITIFVLPDERAWFPLVCRQCQEAPCALTCPTGALSRDQDKPVIKLDRNRCVGCGMCLVSCPFGAIHLDSEVGKTAKCDLCGGDPACVKKCKAGALVFAQPHTLGKRRRTASGAKVAGFIGAW